MPIQIYTDCYTAILLDKETGLTLGPTFGDTFIDPDGPAAYSNLAHSSARAKAFVSWCEQQGFSLLPDANGCISLTRVKAMVNSFRVYERHHMVALYRATK